MTARARIVTRDDGLVADRAENSQGRLHGGSNNVLEIRIGGRHAIPSASVTGGGEFAASCCRRR
jgi:hypothetical protein